MKIKALLSKCDPLLEHRNIVTTIVLYGVFVIAVLFSLLSTFDIIDRFVEFAGMPYKYWLMDDSKDTFFAWISYNYGKGWIPGWLIGIVAGICNYRIIRGKRDGIYWMLVSFYAICFPTLFVELEEFIYFSLSTLVAFIVYFTFLFLPRKEKTYWSVCKTSQNRLKITTFVITLVWAFMLISAYHHFELYQNYSL